MFEKVEVIKICAQIKLCTNLTDEIAWIESMAIFHNTNAKKVAYICSISDNTSIHIQKFHKQFLLLTI